MSSSPNGSPDGISQLGPEEPAHADTEAAEPEGAEGRLQGWTWHENGEAEMTVCRTVDECFAAGWADGADDEPLTQQETERLAALHSPYLRPLAEAS